MASSRRRKCNDLAHSVSIDRPALGIRVARPLQPIQIPCRPTVRLDIRLDLQKSHVGATDSHEAHDLGRVVAESVTAQRDFFPADRIRFLGGVVHERDVENAQALEAL